MIEFRRDKEGNLYAVKDNVVIGRISTQGDIANKKAIKKEKKNGTGS